MSFNSRDLERLKQIGRALPKEITTATPIKSKKPTKESIKHPIEKETNPENLFKEIVKASPDGSVPPHILARLKELESKEPQGLNYKEMGKTLKLREDNKSSTSNSSKKSNKEEHLLYTTFKQLLLEEEE